MKRAYPSPLTIYLHKKGDPNSHTRAYQISVQPGNQWYSRVRSTDHAWGLQQCSAGLGLARNYDNYT